MEITISRMSLEDLNSISDILIKEFDDFWNYSVFKDELSNSNSTYFVAKDASQEIVGFAGVWFGYEEAHITNIVTKKNKRHLGIATNLLQTLVDYCKRRPSIFSLTLEVKESNISAIGLYKKFNFEKVGIRKNYYNGLENAIIMTKKL